jgi:hypothetical protein
MDPKAANNFFVAQVTGCPAGKDADLKAGKMLAK